MSKLKLFCIVALVGLNIDFSLSQMSSVITKERTVAIERIDEKIQKLVELQVQLDMEEVELGSIAQTIPENEFLERKQIINDKKSLITAEIQALKLKKEELEN
jgi:hypothetical protein